MIQRSGQSDYEYRQLKKEMRELESIMNMEVVRGMKIVGSTLVGLGSHQMVRMVQKAIGEYGFDYVIIDEAA